MTFSGPKAFEEPPKYSDGAVGKVGLREYIDKGFLAYDRRGTHCVMHCSNAYHNA